MRKSCRMLLALILILGMLLPTVPVMAQENEGPILDSLEVIPGNIGVSLRFNAMINSINQDNIIVEGIYDGVADRIHPRFEWLGDSLVEILLDEHVMYYSEYRVTIEKDAVFSDLIGNQKVYVEEWSLSDALPSVSLEFGSGSDELGVSTTMTIEFVTDKALSGGADQIIITEYGHWDPGQHFYLDDVSVVFISLDGGQYPTNFVPDYDRMRIWIPQGLNIPAGETVQLTFHNVMTPEEWKRDSSDIFIRTTQHDAWVGKSIWFFDNANQNPANATLKPVDKNGVETIAYNYEQTRYELEFDTIEERNGMSIMLSMPERFNVLGVEGMDMYNSVEIYDTEGLVDVTVTGAVYQPSYIHVYNDGVFTMEMHVNETIPAGEKVRVTLHEDVIRTSPLPGDYMIKMWSFDGQGYSILLPTTVEQGQYQPQPPPRIRDLELQVSNTNSYSWSGEFFAVDLISNGDQVMYTFTGTAVKESDRAHIVFLPDQEYWINFWDEEPRIYAAHVKVDEEWISSLAYHNGQYVVVEFRRPNTPDLVYEIQEGQTFEIQLTLRNPELYQDISQAVFPIILDMNGSEGIAEVEIQKMNPVIGMADPYAGVQAGRYLFEVNDLEGFYSVTLDFPTGTVLPEDISMEDIEINQLYGWGNPPELIDMDVVGDSIKLEFSSFVNQLSVTVLESAGIPTPSTSGSYKYGVTYNGQSVDEIAQLSTVSEDPKLLSAELIGYGNYAWAGPSYAVKLIFDGDLDASYISRYIYAHQSNNLPITITYPIDGEIYSMDACFAAVNPDQANSIWIYVNCELSEIDGLETSTEAMVKMNNSVIRGVGGTYSPGEQSVKLITSGTGEELAEKLAAFVPEGETLNIGHLLQAMRDPEILSLIGGSLNPHTAEMLLQYIDTKFVE